MNPELTSNSSALPLTSKAEKDDALAKARLAASLKTAQDYEQDTPNRSIAEISADLAQVRLELSATVSELTSQLTPAGLTQQAKTQAHHKLADLKTQTLNFKNEIVNGNPQAWKVLLTITAGIAGVLIWRTFK